MVQSSFQLHLLEKKNNRHLEHLYRNLEINKCENKNRVGHVLVKGLIYMSRC